MGCVCILGSFAHYFTTRERGKQEDPNEEKIRLFEAFRMLFACLG